MGEQKKYKIFVDGEWVSTGKTFADYNPATGKVWASIPDSNREQTKNAIEAAKSAQAGWEATPHQERAGYLLKVADILEKRQQDFVDAIIEEGGGWIGKGLFETGYTFGIYRAAAAAVYQLTGEILPSEHGKVSMVVRKPLGVVSVISPWNFPLLLSSRGLAFAMAAGNTIVLKPSEETPVAGGLLIAELFEEAGLPAGVFNVVTCSRENVAEVGDELVVNKHVGGISFTGSTAVGRKIAEKGGYHLKKVAIEAGGKDALIILDDADIEHAINAATFGCFMHQGQICMSVERIIIDEAVADEFTERYVNKVKTLNVGNPREMGNVIGPIINQKQLEKIHSHVTDAVNHGAKLLTGGKYEDLYYYPTVLDDVTPDMAVFQEETFGPVAPIIRVKGIDEAIAAANNSEYGLSAGVITRDEEKGLEVANRLETGMVHINDSSVNDEPHVPFGGFKASGLGRHGGKASIEAFTEQRWLTLERGGRHYPPPFLEKSH
jgi:acyl-CoA reductase-like NAD-dependent aldehyde dehydrogenase